MELKIGLSNKFMVIRNSAVSKFNNLVFITLNYEKKP